MENTFYNLIASLLFLCLFNMNAFAQTWSNSLVEIWSFGRWQLLSKGSNTFDNKGGITYNSFLEWDTPSSSWINSSQTNFTNNNDGSHNSGVLQYWSNGSWVYDYNYAYTYTNDNQVKTLTTKRWQTNKWQNFNYTENSYDENGYLIKTSNYSWDVNTNSWGGNYEENYTNNSNGTKSKCLRRGRNWTTGVWSESFRQTYSYDENGKLTEIFEEVPDANMTWETRRKVTYSYDQNGYLSQELARSWQPFPLESWINVNQKKYTNNPDGTVHELIEEQWKLDQNVWIGSRRNTYEYPEVTTNLSDNTNEQTITVYPNPVADFITIRFNSVIKGANISFLIKDQMGKELMKGSCKEDINRFDLSDLSSGVYVLQLEDNPSKVYKLIKN